MSELPTDLRTLKLDFAEPVESAKDANGPAPGAAANWLILNRSRRLARVRVSLPAEIIIDQNLAIESSTLDISEGGLLLSGYHGPEILPGTRVGVVVKGIISDASAEEGDQFAMEVVRSEGDRLALRFVSGAT